MLLLHSMAAGMKFLENEGAHPYIHFPRCLSESGPASQLPLGEKWIALWTDCRSVTGLASGDGLGFRSCHSWILMAGVRPSLRPSWKRVQCPLWQVVKFKYLVVLFTSGRKPVQYVAVKTDVTVKEKILIYSTNRSVLPPSQVAEMSFLWRVEAHLAYIQREELGLGSRDLLHTERNHTGRFRYLIAAF